jgi:WD40 repeat protein
VVDIRELSGHPIQQLKDANLVYSIDWSRDGRQLAVGYANHVSSVWDVTLAQKITTFRGHQAEVVDVHFLPTEPILLTYSWDETSRLWDVNTGDELLVLQARARGFSADGKNLSFVTSRTIGTWEVLHGDLFRTLKGHSGKSPSSIGISPDGRWLASAGPDGTLLWDLESERTLGWLPSGPAKDVFFGPEQNSLFTCGPQGLKGWTFAVANSRLSRIVSSQLFSQPCERASLDVNGKTLAFSKDEVIRVMPRDSPSTLRVIKGFRGLSVLSVSPGGRWIAAGNWHGNQTQVWDAGSGKMVADLLPDTESVNVLFSPRGKWLVTGTSDNYRLWTVDSWKETARFDRPERFSRLPGLMGFPPDDSLVATTMTQSMIRIFQVDTGKLLLTLEPPTPQAFSDIKFTPDRKRLIVATHGNRILIWEIQRVLDQLKTMRMEQ